MAPPLGGVPKDLTLAEFRQFRDYIHQHSGIFLEESKRDSLRISLVARATRLGIEEWDLYFEQLAHDETEFKELMNLVTINETSFYRFPGQFEVLARRVLPEIARSRSGDNRLMRMWSAGCSTGEEPYTIAMTWFDAGMEQAGFRAEVLGTDVSTKALAIAKAGLYPARALLNLPKDVVRRHFVEVDGSYRVAQHVRRLVDFSYHNLIKEPYPLTFSGGLDVIFCRNVTIYFKLESTKRVVSNLFSALNEGGYLFIGHSETLSSISDELELVELDGVFVYRKPYRVFVPPHIAPASHHTGGRGEGVGSQPRSAPVLGRPGRERAGQERRSAARTPSGAGERGPLGRGRPGQVAEGGAVRRAVPPAEPDPAGVDGAGAVPTSSLTPGAMDPIERARAHMAEGRPAEALAVVQDLLATQRGNTEAILVAAQVHADSGDLTQAIAACHAALAIDPLLPGARYILGLIHLRQNDTVRAVSELKKTVYIDADFALAHLALGNIYKGEGRMHEAARAYDNALRALNSAPEGSWTQYVGGWKADVILRTCERSLLECRKVTGTAL